MCVKQFIKLTTKIIVKILKEIFTTLNEERIVFVSASATEEPEVNIEWINQIKHSSFSYNTEQ